MTKTEYTSLKKRLSELSSRRDLLQMRNAEKEQERKVIATELEGLGISVENLDPSELEALATKLKQDITSLEKEFEEL